MKPHIPGSNLTTDDSLSTYTCLPNNVSALWLANVLELGIRVKVYNFPVDECCDAVGQGWEMLLSLE